MDQFPPLCRWFSICVNAPNPYGYVRYDLCIKPDLTTREWDELLDELALVIARLRLPPSWYKQWLKYWNNSAPIPPEWREKFRDQFWRSFVSSAATREKGAIQFDHDALCGYIGELILYIVQLQLYEQRIDCVPRRPKTHSKDSGIDCLELGGDRDDYETLHYIAWECKGTTQDTPDNFPGKIYRGHSEETAKSFKEMIDQLSDLHRDDEVLTQFIDEMIDDFYLRTPSPRKRFGGCVTYSSSRVAHSGACSRFHSRFRGKLAENASCRQVRLCAAGDLGKIVKRVRDRIWKKLLA